MVAKVYNQIEGLDDKDRFSPVAKLITVRIFIALAISTKWPIFQLDINNAFLHIYLNEERYLIPLQVYRET